MDRDIENTFRDKWAKKGIFEANPDKRKKKYITAAFPYPNSPQHVGHGRTYTTADAYARFLRMKGYNVLFPMAFHVTGTPILAMAKRIAEGDEEIITIFEKIYHIPREKTLSLTDPKDLVMYFSKEIEQGMKEMGYSIDWRRKFYTFDPSFNRFIQWQFKKLKDAGLLIKGEHPVPWCPNDNNAVSAHDTKGDIDPELEEVTVIKFQTPKGFLVATTYRPETVYGVTNLWINPKAIYILVEHKGERLIMSKEAYENLSMQMEIKEMGEIPSEEILKLKAKVPVDDREVPIFPASFVDPRIGTGVVMSVPAHAPYDYLALRDLGKEEEIKLIQVIDLAGYGEFPAKEIVEKLGVKNQEDPKAEEATDIIYKKEAHDGIMVLSPYKGKKVYEAKEMIKEDLIDGNKAFIIHTIANGPVYCRCGALIGVKLVKDQWFIDYGNPEWKEKTKKAFEKMSIIPEKMREEYIRTIDWLRHKACTRSAGLGTKFPFDERYMIDALSDSTIYMAYYTIAHRIKSFKPEELDDAFFDYVFLGKGEPKNEEHKKMREEFLYWYPLDSRHSASDLIKNHLPFFVFNHVAIFPEELWPKQIVTNGFVLMDGKKMSKSMGNILPIREAIKEYGADVVRFSVVSGADLTQDTDFNRTVAEGTRTRLKFFKELLKKAEDYSELSPIDKWFYSRLNRRIKIVEESYEKVDLRNVALEIFYNTFNDLQWYVKRTNRLNLRKFFEVWALLISPLMPYHAEEFWKELGKDGFASLQPFPNAEEGMIDEKIERMEEMIQRIKEDIDEVLKLIKKKPKKMILLIASKDKRWLYEKIRELKRPNLVLEEIKKDERMKKKIGEFMPIIKKLTKNPYALPEAMDAREEEEAISSALDFLSELYECEVILQKEEESNLPKAKAALPNKPAIYVE